MKTAVIFFALVGVALAMPQAPAAPAPAAGGAPAANGGAAAAKPVNPYGPRVFGMGLNNPWALAPNPILIQSALQVLNQTPGALLRVDTDGSLQFTDRFGQDVDITDRFGNELFDF